MWVICSIGIGVDGRHSVSLEIGLAEVHLCLVICSFWIFVYGFGEVGVSRRPMVSSFINILLRDVKIFHGILEYLNLCYVLSWKFVGGIWEAVEEFLEVFNILILDDELIHILFFHESEDCIAGDDVGGGVISVWLLELDFDFLFILGLVLLDLAKFLLNSIYQLIYISILLDVQEQN